METLNIKQFLLLSFLFHLVFLFIPIISVSNSINNKNMISVSLTNSKINYFKSDVVKSLSSSIKKTQESKDDGSKKPSIHEFNSNLTSSSESVSTNETLAKSIKAQINIKYPKVARKEGIEGKVTVICKILKDGSVDKITLDQDHSSHEQILIDEVRRAIETAQFQKLASDTTVVLSFNFKLED